MNKRIPRFISVRFDDSDLAEEFHLKAAKSGTTKQDIIINLIKEWVWDDRINPKNKRFLNEEK